MGSRRIGVAIELPEPYAGELQAFRERYGDPLARRIPPHVTLLPPTSVKADQLDGVEGHLRGVAAAAAAFAVELRGSATFRPVSPVVFVPLVTGIAGCERLQVAVRAGMTVREERFPYHPHVTVAQDVSDAELDRAYLELAGYQAAFRVWGFSLFEQGPDGTWRPQRDFAFGSGAPGPTR